MLKNYLKIALRNLFKYKAFSLINILGLCLGITLCLLILTYVKHELSYDSFHEKRDRIVRVNMESEDTSIGVTPSMVGPSLAAIAPEIEDWVRLYDPTRYSPIVVAIDEQKFQETSFMYADSSFFDIFSFNLIQGNAKTALVKPNSLVLTQSIANKLFGNQEVLGKAIKAQIFNSDIEFEVTGVIQDIPTNSHFSFDYLGSLTTMSNWSQLTDSEIRAANFFTYLSLTSSESALPLQEKIDAFVEEYVREQRDINLSLAPLTDLYFRSTSEFEIGAKGDILKVYGFSFLALVVLLIAIINYINLSTARATRRATEVGIRKAVGAMKDQLVKQFFGESILITFIAVILALVVVELVEHEFFLLMGKPIELNLLDDPFMLLIIMIVAILTSFLAGSYPALFLSSYKPVTVLKGILGRQSSNNFLRKGLVVTQFAISTFLIICTIVIYNQTEYVISANLGFDKESVMVLPARDRTLFEKQDLLKSEILRQPGIISATYMSNIPGRVFGGYSSEHLQGGPTVDTEAGAADRDFVNTLGVELLAGEGFPQNPAYSKEQGYVYLINESLASEFGWKPEEAINQPFNVLGNRQGEIVGVMKDFNFQSLHNSVGPLALFINSDMYNYLLIKIAPKSIPQALVSIEEVWDKIAPHRPFEFEFLDQQLNALYYDEVQSRNLLFLFSVMAILIACLGLIGLSAFLIEQRAKEIGIRKVLGASLLNIVALLSTDFLKLVVVGFIIGAPFAWYAMEKWLTGFAFRIEIGITVFAVCAIIGIVIAFLTVSGQSVKAALANPVESLKSE